MTATAGRARSGSCSCPDAGSDYYVGPARALARLPTSTWATSRYVKRVDLEYTSPPTPPSPQAVPDTGDVAALQGTEVRVRVTPT